MKMIIEFDMETFENPLYEAASVLTTVALKLANGNACGCVEDIDGKLIGEFTMAPSKKTPNHVDL